MQSSPGGHGIEHEPMTPASAFRVELLEEIGVAKVSIILSAFQRSIPLNLEKVYVTD